MTLSEEGKQDLEWWINNIHISYRSLTLNEPTHIIYSDASLTGWGCHINTTNAQGMWSENERKHHINYLELLGAFFALKSFQNKISNSHVRLKLDNITAVKTRRYVAIKNKIRVLIRFSSK